MSIEPRDEWLRDERIADLLAAQATEGLGAADTAELDRLLGAHPGADREVLDRVAAALMLAGRVDEEPLPAGLRRRLVEQAADWSKPAARAPVTDLAAARAARDRGRAVPDERGRGHVGWWVAAAAVLIAVAGWYPRLANTPTQVASLPTPPQPGPAQKREELLRAAAAPGRLVRWDWTGTNDPAATGVRGDVVWDPVTQKGYMRFVGLAANDARDHQYQLWIFDAERDQRYPVDGGVFDVPAGRTEVVVPIDARLAVAKPAMFAVTVEKPGGVVVSARERIVVLAKPGQA
jgi:hypothetical protein